MRFVHVCIAAAVIGFAVPAAQAQVMREEDCLLSAVKNVQSRHALALIKNACNFLSGWSSTMELSRDERTYKECLVKEQPGVQNDQATQLVVHACFQKAYNANH